jgi:Flp pilus assembly protein protease CpaA
MLLTDLESPVRSPCPDGLSRGGMANWLDLIPICGTALAAWQDARTREIPDGIAGGLLVCGLLVAATGTHSPSLLSALLGFIAAAGLTGLLAWFDGIGGGDVKLLGALGAWVGWPGVVGLLVWTAVGGLFSALTAYRQGRTTFAYGPAIFAGLMMHLATPGLFRLA